MNYKIPLSLDNKLVIPRITHDFIPNANGPTNQIFAISMGLKKFGISSPIITTSHNNTEISTYQEVCVHRYQANLAISKYKYSKSLLKYLEGIDAPFFHIHGWRNPVSDSVILLARQRKIPYVVQSHGVAFGFRYVDESLSFKIIRKLHDAIFRRLLIKSATAVIASSDLEVKELEEYGFPKSKIVKISVGVNNYYFIHQQKPRKPHSNVINLLTVSRISPRRNLEQIIQAVARIKSRGVKVHLRIVGPEVKLTMGEINGYKQQLEKLTAELGLSDIVSFLGPLYDDALLHEYQNADVFIYTSLYENFGQPIAEAAATGLPIISTPTGVAIDLLKDNVAGFLVPFHNVETTTEILYRLSQNPGLRLKLGQSAQKLAENLFDWKNILPRYVDLYNNILYQTYSPRYKKCF